MAQVVYDQHPLGDYLKGEWVFNWGWTGGLMCGADEAGEQAVSMSMPGGDCPVASDEEQLQIDTPSARELLEPLIRLIRVRVESMRIPRCLGYYNNWC